MSRTSSITRVTVFEMKSTINTIKKQVGFAEFYTKEIADFIPHMSIHRVSVILRKAKFFGLVEGRRTIYGGSSVVKWRVKNE